MYYDNSTWMSWFDELADKDFVVVDNFIPEELYQLMSTFFRENDDRDKLRKAGIGSTGEFQVESSVRGDYIYWVDRTRDNQLAPVFDLLDELILNLKQICFLSVSGSEFHFAKYPAGSFYKRHLDQFHNRNNRQITVLIYLNDCWKKGDGGELKLYLENGDLLVEPLARRLILFKSEAIEHEVLKTRVPRYSFTGWLLKQESQLLFVG
jgi:SM-20-related protein